MNYPLQSANISRGWMGGGGGGLGDGNTLFIKIKISFTLPNLEIMTFRYLQIIKTYFLSIT